jgi:hypothetical protein
MFSLAIRGMKHLVSLPSPEATAAHPRPALGAAPIDPRLRWAHPSGMYGTYLPLGLPSTSTAQTPYRMVAAISTTVITERKMSVSQ